MGLSVNGAHFLNDLKFFDCIIRKILIYIPLDLGNVGASSTTFENMMEHLKEGYL